MALLLQVFSRMTRPDNYSDWNISVTAGFSLPIIIDPELTTGS